LGKSALSVVAGAHLLEANWSVDAASVCKLVSLSVIY
jgi:hypothetical protein